MTRIVLLAFVVSIQLASAENWPRFRGPDGSGIAASSTPLTWSETENMKWSLDLPGPGSSSPIVWGDRVFVTCYSGYGDGSGGAIGDLKRHLICIDRATGKTLWQTEAPGSPVEDPFQGFLTEHGYASSTPVTDGRRIFCFFGKAGVFAYDWDGKGLWQAKTGTLSSRKVWGSASSPILVDDKVIVVAGDEAQTVFAFDQETGKEIWKAEGYVLEQIYATPVLHRVSNERTDLIVSGQGGIWGMNPATGKLRWFAEMDLTGNLSASPTVIGDRIIQFGGYPRTMGIGIRAGGEGDVTESARLWQNNDAKSYMTMPVLHEGLIYWVSDAGIACCADPDTGELVYEKRLEGASGRMGKGKPVYASQVLVDGHLLVVTRRGGTFVIEARPEYKVVGHNVIAGDESRFQGTPAVSNGDLFLRSEKALYCIGEK